MSLINLWPETVFTKKADELLDWRRASSAAAHALWSAVLHKETGQIFREYTGRDYNSSHRPLETAQAPKKFQLELIGTESEDRPDKKIGPWDAIKIYEFDEAVELSKYFYEAKALDAVKGAYVTTALEKQPLEEKQLELYGVANEKN